VTGLTRACHFYKQPPFAQSPFAQWSAKILPKAGHFLNITIDQKGGHKKRERSVYFLKTTRQGSKK
jgi:hypothetical protein